VTQLSRDALCTPDTFSIDRFDCLLLTRSSHVPAEAAKVLETFVKAGGGLVLLGGDSFTDPVALVDNEWLTQDAMRNRLKQTTIAQRSPTRS